MPDSNPGPLSQKSDEPPNLHEPPLSLFTVAEVRVCVCVFFKAWFMADKMT